MTNNLTPEASRLRAAQRCLTLESAAINRLADAFAAAVVGHAAPAAPVRPPARPRNEIGWSRSQAKLNEDVLRARRATVENARLHPNFENALQAYLQSPLQATAACRDAWADHPYRR